MRSLSMWVAVIVSSLAPSVAGASVTGRVLSIDGVPIAGAAVRAGAPETVEERAERWMAGRARTATITVRTGPDGTFRLEGTGAFTAVEAVADGFAPAFRVAADGDRVTLVLTAAVARKGRVVAKGQPVARAIVIWSAREGEAESITTTGADGSYEVPDPGRWDAHAFVLHPDFAMQVTARGGEGWPLSLRGSLVKEVSPGVALTGRVADAEGHPLVGASLWLDGWPCGRSGADGSFTIAHAPVDWSALVARTPTQAGRVAAAPNPLLIRTQPAHMVTGTVHEPGGAPVAGAAVVLSLEDGSPLNAGARSDARGHYEVRSLPGERYRATATRDGWSEVGENLPVVDTRSRAVTALDLTLSRARHLTGTVRDERGAPVGRARIVLQPAEMPAVYAGESPGALQATELTGDDGSFSLEVPEMSYGYLRFASGQQFCVIAYRTGFAAARSPGFKMGTGPLPPVTLTLQRGPILSGRVTTPEGAPLQGVAIVPMEAAPNPRYGGSFARSLLAQRGEERPWATTDADGRFQLALRAVAHDIAFRKAGFVGLVQSGVEPSASLVNVVLAPAAVVRGRVLRADGSGAGGAFVGLEQAGGSAQANVTADDDGAFAVTELPAGVYEMAVVEMRRGGAGTAVRRVVQAPADDVVVTMGATGSLSGRVTDARTGAPVRHYDIAVHTGDDAVEAMGGTETTVNSDDGRFTVADTPVGTLEVTVSSEGYLERTVPDVVVPAEGAAREVEISLEPGAVLRGHVTDGTGAAIAEATISATGGDANAYAAADADGAYELTGIRPGRVEVEAQHAGFVGARRTVDVSSASRLDFVLERGLSLSGVVEGARGPVAEASVVASSSQSGASPQNVNTDASGRFSLSGLLPAHYTVSASAEEGEASLEDVDAEHSGPLRLQLKRAPTAVLHGRVAGMPPRGEMLDGTVHVESEEGRSEDATLDQEGRFRLDAPTGPVQVHARVKKSRGVLWSAPVPMTLVAGSDNEVELVLAAGVRLTGAVTRSEAAVVGAVVTFAQEDGTGNEGSAGTDQDGRYEIEGLQPGAYSVAVRGIGLDFHTRHVIEGAEQYDIDATTGGVAGEAVDAEGGAPLSGVSISAWRAVAGEKNAVANATTDGAGHFRLPNLVAGRYRLLTHRAGYGQATLELDVPRGESAQARLTLTRSDGLHLRVVDARDGRTLDAIVVVRDAHRQVVADRHSGKSADGSVTVSLAPGAYLLSTSSSGYGTATLPVSVPAAELRVGLTPGGTLVVTSARDLRGRVRLVRPDGEEYVRCWCNGLADIDVHGRRTVVENITPGPYTVEWVGATDATDTRAAGQVLVEEGKTATVNVE